MSSEWEDSCGPGWSPIIRDLIKDLEALGLFKIDQIKEKFGYLRVYARCSSSDSEVQNKFRERIQEAENESSKVCEKCGSRENVASDSWNGYWIKTLCPPCVELSKKGRAVWQRD